MQPGTGNQHTPDFDANELKLSAAVKRQPALLSTRVAILLRAMALDGTHPWALVGRPTESQVLRKIIKISLDWRVCVRIVLM